MYCAFQKYGRGEYYFEVEDSFPVSILTLLVIFSVVLWCEVKYHDDSILWVKLIQMKL
jgi:hypothetical protein